MLATVEQYRIRTGDRDSAREAVTGALTEAQRLLEDELGRELETGVRTERLTFEPDGTIYPTVTPITNAGSYTTMNGVVYGVPPTMVPFTGIFPTVVPLYVDFTYTGGFNPAQTDRSAVDYVPECFVRDLCIVAYSLLRPAPVVSMAPGATAVRLGDAAVTYARDVPTSEVGVEWSCETLRWRRR